MSKLRFLNPIYIIKGVYKRIDCFIKQQLFSLRRRIGIIRRARIIEFQSCGTKIHVFKEPTIEEVPMNEVYGFIKEGSFKILYPEISLWKFENATVLEGADYVLLDENLVCWKKYFAYNYSKNIPLDKLFVKEENGSLFYKRPRKHLKVDVAFSLLGVHDQIWSHSLSEYYPKISELQYAINDSDGKVAVLVPKYTDGQLKEIMYDELSRYDNIEIVPIDDCTAVQTRVLYYIERPTTFTDHEMSVAIGDDVQPKIIADILKEKLVTPRLKSADGDKHIKLFLPRKGFGRNLINNAEVEDYFRNRGYVFMDYPHKMTLKEKIAMFHSADVIVGPFGSAFSNIIFCRPNTKILIFSNFSRFYEAWLCMHKKYFNLDMLWVTGYDDKNVVNHSHCSYYIPLDKIVLAAKSLGL